MKESPEAARIKFVFPSYLIEFPDDNADQSLLKTGWDILKRNGTIKYEVDLRNRVMRFVDTEQSTKAYLLLSIQGLRPWFPKK